MSKLHDAANKVVDLLNAEKLTPSEHIKTLAVLYAATECTAIEDGNGDKRRELREAFFLEIEQAVDLMLEPLNTSDTPPPMTTDRD